MRLWFSSRSSIESEVLLLLEDKVSSHSLRLLTSQDNPETSQKQ